jgi:hypothetical protein
MYRRADPTFTNWKPTTAFEAVDRFTRCRQNGLKAIMIPECLIECSRDLPEPELDKFEEWIINPGGLDYSKAVPDDNISKENASLYLETSDKRETVPPLPPVDEDDEKMPDVAPVEEDVVMELQEANVQELGNGEVLVGPVSSRLAAMAVCGLL